MTIPKKITNKGELVIIPRFEYEALLKSQQKNKIKKETNPSSRKATKGQEKTINIAGTELEKELNKRTIQALKEVKSGKATVWKKGSLLGLVK